MQLNSSLQNNSKVLKNAKLEVLQDLVKRIEVGYDLIKDQIILDTTRSHPSMAEVISSPEYGKTRKHLLQVSSLLAHLDDLSLLEANSCFMEFGAGRGEVMRSI